MEMNGCWEVSQKSFDSDRTGDGGIDTNGLLGETKVRPVMGYRRLETLSAKGRRNSESLNRYNENMAKIHFQNMLLSLLESNVLKQNNLQVAMNQNSMMRAAN